MSEFLLNLSYFVAGVLREYKVFPKTSVISMIFKHLVKRNMTNHEQDLLQIGKPPMEDRAGLGENVLIRNSDKYWIYDCFKHSATERKMLMMCLVSVSL